MVEHIEHILDILLYKAKKLEVPREVYRDPQWRDTKWREENFVSFDFEDYEDEEYYDTVYLYRHSNPEAIWKMCKIKRQFLTWMGKLKAHEKANRDKARSSNTSSQS